MPNKTIYVSDDDLPLYQRAQELAGVNLSATIARALRRFIEVEEGRLEGYDEVVVRVGPGAGRKQRFVGVLLAEWGRSSSRSVEVFRVYRTRRGQFAVHVERSGAATQGPDTEKWSTGWRGYVGNWSVNQTWGYKAGEATLSIAETFEDLRNLVPSELYDMVASAAEFPGVEDLDI